MKAPSIKVGVIAERQVRCRSRESPTPTSRRWSSTTSTRGAACWAVTSSSSSRTARRSTASPRPRPRSSSSTDDVDVIFGASTAPRARPSRAPPSSRGRSSTSIPSSTRDRSATRSSSARAPCRRSRSIRSFPGSCARTGAKRFYLPSADYIWPRTMNQKVREVVTAHGGTIVGEEYFPLEHGDYGQTIEKIMSSGAEVVFNTTVPPGVASSSSSFMARASASGADHLVCHVLRRELPQHGAGRARRGPVQLPRLLPGRRRSLRRGAARAVRSALPRRRQVHGGQRLHGLYRGLKLWEAAVKTAGTLAQREVIAGSIARASPRGRAAPPRWCPASTTSA